MPDALLGGARRAAPLAFLDAVPAHNVIRESRKGLGGRVSLKSALNSCCNRRSGNSFEFVPLDGCIIFLLHSSWAVFLLVAHEVADPERDGALPVP